MFQAVIKIWCLKEKDEKSLRKIHHEVVKALKPLRHIRVRSEREILVLFPPDLMSYGLGEEIFIEVKFIQELTEEKQVIFDSVSFAIEDLFEKLYEHRVRVACVVYSWDNKFTSRCFSHQ